MNMLSRAEHLLEEVEKVANSGSQNAYLDESFVNEDALKGSIGNNDSYQFNSNTN